MIYNIQTQNKNTSDHVQSISWSSAYKLLANDTSFFSVVHYLQRTLIFLIQMIAENHWVKSFQIRGFFLSVFSCIRTEYRDLRSTDIQENTDLKKLRIWTLFTQLISQWGYQGAVFFNPGITKQGQKVVFSCKKYP